MTTYSDIISRQADVLHELELLRASINGKLTAILAQGDIKGAREAAIVAHWLSDDTVPAKRLTARAESICRFLGGRRHV